MFTLKSHGKARNSSQLVNKPDKRTTSPMTQHLSFFRNYTIQKNKVPRFCRILNKFLYFLWTNSVFFYALWKTLLKGRLGRWIWREHSGQMIIHWWFQFLLQQPLRFGQYRWNGRRQLWRKRSNGLRRPPALELWGYVRREKKEKKLLDWPLLTSSSTSDFTDKRRRLQRVHNYWIFESQRNHWPSYFWTPKPFSTIRRACPI